MKKYAFFLGGCRINVRKSILSKAKYTRRMGVNPRTLDNVTAETIGKTRKRQETLTKYTKKENYFVQFDKKSQKRARFRNSIAGNVIELHGTKRYNAYIEKHNR